ncbi:MAG TPA: GTP cyclohydrolase I, partial [Promineifilum sp.]|nr:GTP cyclohydrolase I [Promineifilum sp.]
MTDEDDEREDLPDGPVLSSECKRIVADSVTTILRAVGEDPQREGLLRTPARVARAYDELLAGYSMDPRAILNQAMFEVTYSEMVVVTDIDFYSLCEHHMLPFIGRAHVAYIPNRKVVGLSKIPRLVEMYARRLQIQERMTREIADI